MNAKRLLGVLLTVGFSLAAVTPAADVHAQKKKKEEAPATEPPATKKAIALTLTGVAWGQSPKQLGDLVDKILDEDYRPLYKEMQPGIRMKELDAQIAEDKAQFRRSRVDFGRLPTGIDATPLRGEYTYNNREALMSFSRKGELTYFFFIQEKLWKIIEERRLSDTAPLGKNYAEAVVKISTTYGTAGRVVPPAPGRFAVEVDWKDATTHLRAIQRSDTALGLAFEENATVANLDALRPNKPVDDNAIDPDVAAAMRAPSKDPGPPDPKDKKKK